MSYFEYFDLFYLAQQKDCKYKAFMFDVKNSKTTKSYYENVKLFHQLIDNFIHSLKREEVVLNTKILLDDKYNILKSSHIKVFDETLCNPMILGDMFTVFIYNNSIPDSKIKQIFIEELNNLNINFKFHFEQGKYETNNYTYGSTLMYKGYMPQILENLSKKTNIIIDKNTKINNFNLEK